MRARAGQAAAATIALAILTSHAQQVSSPELAPQTAPDKSSKARVALLSEVKGDVALDGNTGIGFRKAFAHSPIAEQCRLQTGIGRAEVEFEDSSTLRLAPYSSVEFSRLKLLPSGLKASTIRLLKGTAYISLTPSYVVKNKGDDFLLTFGQEKLHMQPSSHIRLDLKDTEARLSVFDGRSQIEGPFGTADLRRKRTFIFNLESQSEPAVERKVHAAPLDKWDSLASEYHRRSANLGISRGSGTKASTGARHDIWR